MSIIGYLVSDGTTGTPARMVLVETRDQTEDAIIALGLQSMRDMVVVNPVEEPINADPAVTTYRQVGETEVRFTVNLNPYLSHLKRIRDFLVGMGVLEQDGYLDWEPTLQMTVSQKERWDKWFAKVQETQNPVVAPTEEMLCTLCWKPLSQCRGHSGDSSW